MKQGKFSSALAASMALHLLLLWPAASLHQKDDEIGQSLSVILRPQTGLLQGTSDSTTSLNTSPRAVRETRLEERTTHAMSAMAQPLLKDVALGNEPTAEAGTSSQASSQSSGTIIERDAARPANGPAARGMDADGVRQYRMALAVEARRFKRYPPRALADEIAGTVEIRVAVSAGGQPQEVALAKSSGHESLDDAALEMMRKAASRAAVPELLRRSPFVVNLPVVFDVASE